MAPPVDAPDGLTLKRHRDLLGRERRPVARWLLIAALCVVLALGLLNVFGQRRVESSAETAVAAFRGDAPTRLRGGLFFQARFRIEARRELENATLVLAPGWLHDITLNTVEPAPVGEASRDGRIALELGRIPAGDEFVLYLHFQVNPTAVGRRSQDVELSDGETPVASLERDAWIWP